MTVHSKKTILIFGMPGSGKDTQADLLQKNTGLVRVRTSKLLEDKFNNTDPSDTFLMEQKKIWHEGKLNDPEWVTSIVIEKIKELSGKNKGTILSASPRTLYEAKVEMPLFEELYGRDNIKIFLLKLSDEEAVKRNTKRLVCEANEHPIDPKLVEEGIKICPIDGSLVVTRTLDNEETMKMRLSEFYNRTSPIFDFLRENSFQIIEINGEQPIEKVHEDIMEYLA